MLAFKNSILIATLSTIISTILGTISAIGLKKFKFFSKLLAVLVIVPAILLCTACGGGQLAQEAKLEQKEFTQLTSVTEFQTKMAEIEETQITGGYHMSFNMKMNMPMMGMNFEKFNMVLTNMQYFYCTDV